MLNVPVTLRELRLQSGMTQIVVANQLGFASSATISHYEVGHRDPSLHTFMRMIELYGKDLAIREVVDER